MATNTSGHSVRASTGVRLARCVQLGTGFLCLMVAWFSSGWQLAGQDAQEQDDPAPPPSRIDPFWKDLPTTQRPSRPGNYAIPPSGPGYYSLRDRIHGCCRESSPPNPYAPFGLMAPSFFDVNWKFLDDPENHWGLTDGLKRRPVGHNWLVTTGGSVWWRYMNENNSRLTGINQNYDLVRTRVYADALYRDWARFYIEFIDAQRFGGALPALPIDENHSDLLNAFVELQLLEISGNPWHARLGRQEMMFGSQRLITTLDWANTRRTFSGVRFFRRGEHSDLDVFWTQPVIPDRANFDRVDGNQHFVGAWLTRRPRENRAVDHYYLYLNNSAPPQQLGQPVPEFNVHTFGTRINGSRDHLHYDYEGMLQLGNRGAQDIVAGAFTAGHGVHGSQLPWSPTLWLYYDWASGDRNPGAGNHNTFNQLFAFGHYYLGFVDIVGRQNIHDVSLHLTLYPSHWITFNFQYHHFQLAAKQDALYNPAGVATRQDPTGGSGRHVGDEIDFLWNFHLGPHSDVLVGYSRLFNGRFLRDTGAGTSVDLFYAQYGFRW